MKYLSDLTAEYVLSRLNYDGESGVFTWLPKEATTAVDRTWNTRFAGKPAGCISQDSGYLMIGIGLRLYRAHRLAWLIMKGEWPEQQIDHKNLNRSDNRWSNLRLATSADNKGNIRAHCDNESGYKGVVWDRTRSSWRAEIMRQGKRTYLGRFDRIEDAAAAYKMAAERLFGEFARIN